MIAGIASDSDTVRPIIGVIFALLDRVNNAVHRLRCQPTKNRFVS